MLKVFLVEDEFVIREGIKKKIDWTGNGYEFCGEATDGEVAFPMIQKIKPDIVITDIKMPFMDGLTLSKLIKKELPDTEIIILTGYERFDYAKEAINIGVAQYLSKPINSEELLKEVNATAVRIREKKHEKEIREKYRLEMAENLHRDRRKLFKYLVSGNKSMPELLEMAENLNIDLSSIWYNVILFETKELNHSNTEYSDSIVKATQRLKTIEDEYGILAFEARVEGKAYVIKGDTKDELIDTQNEFVDKLKEVLSEYEDIVYFGGIGTPVNRLSELKVSFDNAGRAFSYRHFVGANRFVSSENTQPDVNIKKEEFNIRQCRCKTD
ncbi:MAG: response regulator [Lachnospiraceae bacterium]|nr:response regulator [Lachnospiraceae bacterium]